MGTNYNNVRLVAGGSVSYVMLITAHMQHVVTVVLSGRPTEVAASASLGISKPVILVPFSELVGSFDTLHDCCIINVDNLQLRISSLILCIYIYVCVYVYIAPLFQ